MTNEELKKKIESIIRNAKRDFAYCVPEEWAVKVLADALIAAGIGDVKDAEIERKAYEVASNQYRIWFEEQKDRAEVAQLIAERACELVFSEEINDEDWVNVIFNYKKEKGIREIGITTNILYDYLKDQAEKELSEENGGKKKV